MARERYTSPNVPENNTPFNRTLETITEKPDINAIIHSVKKEQPELPEVYKNLLKAEHQTPDFAITEYFNQGRDIDWFKKQKKYYERIKKELGDLLPDTHFIVGEPSNPRLATEGKSFYVMQDTSKDDALKNGKEINDLNEQEFSVETMQQLLELQEKIRAIIETENINTEDQLDIDPKQLNSIDQKNFKNDILYNPDTGEMKLTGLFDIDMKTARQLMDNQSKFEPNKLKFLSMMGLAKLQEKIGGFLEKSQAKEWAMGKDIYWGLDNKKTENGKNSMALTFDDGPNEQTEELLDILKEKNVKATFFVVGSLIEGREHILKRIADEGHNIGMHEWNHKVMSEKVDLKKRLVGPLDSFGDIKKTMDKIEEVTGQRPTMGRVAGTHGTLESLREVQSQDLKMIHAFPTDVALLTPNPKMSAEKMLKIANHTRRPGKIGLFHIGDVKPWGEVKPEDLDTKKGEKYYPPDETLKMIGQYIDDSIESGYEFVDLDQYTQRKSKKD